MPRERWLPPIRCMHEWPLVLFTALAIPGAGVYAARLVVGFAGVSAPSPGYLFGLALGLVTAGLLLSLLHLGRPGRAVLALSRLGRNRLSTEAAFAAAVAVAGALVFVPFTEAAHRTLMADMAAVGSIGFLATLGYVYFLRARSPWRGLVVVTPLVSGLAAGLVILCAVPGGATAQPLAFLFVGLDAVVVAIAWRQPPNGTMLPAHPAIFLYRRRLLTLRLVFANLLPVGLLVAGFGPGAAIAAGAGVLLDRFSFYGLAVGRTTEAAVAEVEQRWRLAYSTGATKHSAEP